MRINTISCKSDIDPVVLQAQRIFKKRKGKFFFSGSSFFAPVCFAFFDGTFGY